MPTKRMTCYNTLLVRFFSSSSIQNKRGSSFISNFQIKGVVTTRTVSLTRSVRSVLSKLMRAKQLWGWDWRLSLQPRHWSGHLIHQWLGQLWYMIHILCYGGYRTGCCGINSHHTWRSQICRRFYGFIVRDRQIVCGNVSSDSLASNAPIIWTLKMGRTDMLWTRKRHFLEE